MLSLPLPSAVKVCVIGLVRLGTRPDPEEVDGESLLTVLVLVLRA